MTRESTGPLMENGREASRKKLLLLAAWAKQNFRTLFFGSNWNHVNNKVIARYIV